jgi:FkbM family methyltransferase
VIALAVGKRSIRKLGLYALSRVNPGDIRIRHHYTGDRIKLHSFRHKGYWFHGRRRESTEMTVFASLVRSGDRVIEVGGHIGYISLLFARLVGPGGSVHVFEPGPNNLPYLRHNVASHGNVSIVDKAVGDEVGVLPMHIEDLTGQNNSMVAEFAGLAVNQRNAVRANVVQHLVDVTTLDTYLDQEHCSPDFIKIDVEGFEWEVLRGARATLQRCHPALMVEVQSHRTQIGEFLKDLGYRLYAADGRRLAEIPDHTVNVFCIPPGREMPGAQRYGKAAAR